MNDLPHFKVTENHSLFSKSIFQENKIAIQYLRNLV